MPKPSSKPDVQADLPFEPPAAPAGQPSSDHMRPGDEAPPGTAGSGENVCKHCGGSGRIDGEPCPICEGTGFVNVGIGGA